MLTIVEHLIIECCSNQQERDTGGGGVAAWAHWILLHSEGQAAIEANLTQSLKLKVLL